MWEDPENENGGKWTIIPSQKDHRELSYYWANAVLAIIGGSLLIEGAADDEICGAVLSRRVTFLLLSDFCVQSRITNRFNSDKVIESQYGTKIRTNRLFLR